MRKFTLITGLLALVLCSCSTLPTPAEKYQQQSAAKLFNDAEKALAKREYNNAIEHYEALDSLYPYNDYHEQALLDSIYAYYKAGDYATATAVADRFMRLYPRSDHADYAYFMKGVADFEQGRGWLQRYVAVDLAQRDSNNALQAFADFNQLVALFPHSPYAADAKQRMIYLRNMLAEHEVRAADFYLQKAAYIAAVNRAHYMLEHYQQTPATHRALQIMVIAYQKLGLNERAQQAQYLEGAFRKYQAPLSH